VPPSVPIKPSVRHGMMAGLVLGLFAGVGLVSCGEYGPQHRGAGRDLVLPGATELAVVPSKLVERPAWKLFGNGGLGRRGRLPGRRAWWNAAPSTRPIDGGGVVPGGADFAAVCQQAERTAESNRGEQPRSA